MMETFSFYVVIETTTGKTYQSDTEGIREYVSRVFVNSSNIPIDGCWDKIQHYIDTISNFGSASQRVCLTINGQAVYFNPRHIVTIKLVRL